jgi:hypothetical protein
MTCSPVGLGLFESLPNGEADDVHDVGVGHDIDLPLASAAGAHNARKLELCQVMADRSDALTRRVGQGAHIAIAAGE